MTREKQDDNLCKMHQSQLYLLNELKTICDKHNIRFYLACGTAIGAVRHNGFIPWDDDIDVYMRNEDINKLLLLQKYLPENVFIQTHDNDPEYGLLIVRLRDSNTTLIEADHVDRDMNQGIYIDIYPLFNCPENKLKMKIMIWYSLVCRLFVYNAAPMNKGKVYALMSKVLLKLLPRVVKTWLVKKTYAYLVSRPQSKYVSCFPDISMGLRYLNEWFLEPSFGTFEGETMPLPTNTDDYLTYLYGDYMKLPPEEKRQVHHNYLFVDFEHSYREYKGTQYCICNK